MTTRETDVAIYANTSCPHKMNLLDLDSSWKLLRDKVFGLEHDHPPELEEIGKKIAKKCQGLPLIISVIAGHLSKTVPKTLESWKYVAKTLSEIIASHPNKCLGVLGLRQQGHQCLKSMTEGICIPFTIVRGYICIPAIMKAVRKLGFQSFNYYIACNQRIVQHCSLFLNSLLLC